MTSLATAQDVADIWRALSSAEQTQATTLCTKASALLRQRLPTVDARIALFSTSPTDPAALDPLVVANVVAGMVKRVLVNPTGAVNRSVSVDGVSTTMNFVGSRFAQADIGLGELDVTDQDIEKLTPQVGQRFLPASMRMVPAMVPCIADGSCLDVDPGIYDPIDSDTIYGPYYG